MITQAFLGKRVTQALLPKISCVTDNYTSGATQEQGHKKALLSFRDPIAYAVLLGFPIWPKRLHLLLLSLLITFDFLKNLIEKPTALSYFFVASYFLEIVSTLYK